MEIIELAWVGYPNRECGTNPWSSSVMCWACLETEREDFWMLKLPDGGP